MVYIDEKGVRTKMKSSRFEMRLSPDEKKSINENAASLGLTVATFLLACAEAYNIGAKAGDKVAERILKIAKEKNTK